MSRHLPARPCGNATGGHTVDPGCDGQSTVTLQADPSTVGAGEVSFIEHTRGGLPHGS
jgi:hypothetical protein